MAGLFTILLLTHAPMEPATVPVKKISLDEAIQIALKQHPSLRRTGALVQAANARVAQAKAGYYPFVDLADSITTGPAGAPALGLRGLAGTPFKKHYGGSINLTQTLYDFGKTRHSVSRARALFDASIHHDQAQKADVVLDTHLAYYHVLLAQQLQNVSEEAVKQREQTVKQARAHFEAGLKSRVDVRLAELELLKAQARLTEARDNVEAALAELIHALGEENNIRYEVDGAATNTVEQPPFEEAVAESLQSRPELRESESRVRAARDAVQAARSQKTPNLVGVSSFGRVHPPDSLRNSRQRQWYAFGFAMTMPVFTGGKIESEVREARENLVAQESAQGELQQNIRLQLTRAFLNVQTQRANLAAAEQQVKTAEDALKLATLRYQSNLSDIVELTQAQVAHTEAFTARAAAIYNLKIAQAVLLYATGSLVPGESLPSKR